MRDLGAVSIHSEQFDSKRISKASLSSSRIKPNSEAKNCEVNDHVHHNLPMSTVIGIKEK
jgi:hypothetical protein